MSELRIDGETVRVVERYNDANGNPGWYVRETLDAEASAAVIAALESEKRLRAALERLGATEMRSYDGPFDGASSNGEREVCVACNLSVATCESWRDSKCSGRIARRALAPLQAPTGPDQPCACGHPKSRHHVDGRGGCELEAPFGSMDGCGCTRFVAAPTAVPVDPVLDPATVEACAREADAVAGEFNERMNRFCAAGGKVTDAVYHELMHHWDGVAYTAQRIRALLSHPPAPTKEPAASVAARLGFVPPRDAFFVPDSASATPRTEVGDGEVLASRGLDAACACGHLLRDHQSPGTECYAVVGKDTVGSVFCACNRFVTRTIDSEAEGVKESAAQVTETEGK